MLVHPKRKMAVLHTICETGCVDASECLLLRGQPLVWQDPHVASGRKVCKVAMVLDRSKNAMPCLPCVEQVHWQFRPAPASGKMDLWAPMINRPMNCL